jgi:hypothetical protein
VVERKNQDFLALHWTAASLGIVVTIRAPFYWGILLFAMQACCAQTACAGNSFFGKWIVKDVLCSDCGKRVPAEDGTIIEFTPGQIRNPLAEDCARDPGYSLLNEMSGTQVIARHGKRWPRPVSRVTLKQEKVYYGFVTCGGINLMQMLFISDKRAFYFFEGGIAFDLQRAESTSQPASPH